MVGGGEWDCADKIDKGEPAAIGGGV